MHDFPHYYMRGPLSLSKAELALCQVCGVQEARQYTLVGWIRLASMGLTQSIGLVSTSVSIYCSLGYYGLYFLTIITKPRFGGVSFIIRTELNRRSPSEAHDPLAGFVVLVAVVVVAVAGLIAGVVAKNQQISMALMVFYSLGNLLLSSC